VDVAPTALALLGVPVPDGLDGISLLPLIRGQRDDGRVAYGEAMGFHALFGLSPPRLLREGRWKYIHKVEPELYDLEADPGELRDLADERPEIARRLRGRLGELLAAAPDAGADARARVDAEAVLALRALGYVGAGTGPAPGAGLDSLALSGEDPRSRLADSEAFIRGGALLELRQFEAALAELAPLRERRPDDPHALDLAAVALMGLERESEALALLRRLLELEPSHLRGRLGLAAVHERRGEVSAAARILSELAAENPCDRQVQLRLNQLLYDARRFADQHAAVKAGAEGCPDLTDNLNNYAWVLATSPADGVRDGALAVEVARRALAQRGEPDPGTLDTLAAALAEAGRFDEAARTQARALALLEAAGAPPQALAPPRARLEAYRAGRATRDPGPEAGAGRAGSRGSPRVGLAQRIAAASSRVLRRPATC
jgi:tetratricopeptide (TPR) repeat protein